MSVIDIRHAIANIAGKSIDIQHHEYDPTLCYLRAGDNDYVILFSSPRAKHNNYLRIVDDRNLNFHTWKRIPLEKSIVPETELLKFVLRGDENSVLNEIYNYLVRPFKVCDPNIEEISRL